MSEESREYVALTRATQFYGIACRARGEKPVMEMITEAAQDGAGAITCNQNLPEGVLDALRENGFDVSDVSTHGEPEYLISWGP